MAKKEQAPEEQTESPVGKSVLNPKLDVGSYTFEDGRKFEAKTPVFLTSEEHEKYAAAKYAGVQVVVKSS